MSDLKHILLVLACLLLSLGVRAQGITLSGTVTDKSTGAPVSFATVVVDATEQWAVADAKGKFVLRNVSVAASIVRVDCLGYVTWARDMKFGKDIDFRVELSPDNLSLESAIVTAQEDGNSATTTRTIDRMALDHVQLMNVSDISSLLPGGATVDPSLTSEKQFNIRAGSGEKGAASFGTAVEVDGVRLSNNASFVAASDFDNKPVKGVSTNNIASSNIESVEVITGVPSVEYGDMGSGIVKVNLKKGKTPFMVTLSTSPSTKQASVSKGFDLGSTRRGRALGVVNASAEYAQSISKQMSPYTAYRRQQLSVSYTNTLSRGIFYTMPLRVTVGVTGNLGGMNSTADPDAVQGTWSKGKDNAIQGHFDLNWLLSKPWITSLELSGSASYSDKSSQERTFNSSSINKTVLHGREEGYGIAVPYAAGTVPSVMYIPAGYWYNTMCDDDRPLATKLSFKANHSHLFGKVNNKIKLGADWTTDRNFGIGANSPEMETAPTFREYRYRDVPTMHNVGVYLEDNIMIPVGTGHINLIAGLRNDNTVIRGSAYGVTSSLSPRFNAKYTVFKRTARDGKAFRELSFRASWGESVKLPSFAVLFPMPTYRDVRVFASTTNSANESFEAYYTQPRSVEYNPNLKWQRNRMMEIGVDADLLGTRISLAAYYNRTLDAYRVSTRYDRISYAYTMDNALVGVPIAADDRAFTINPQSGIVTVSDKTGVLPSQELAYQTYKELSPSYYPDNELNPIDRYGVEWVIEFARIKAIQTDIRLDGNWYAYKALGTNQVAYSPTTYRSSKDKMPYPYIGLYYGDNAYSNGSESQSLRMNLTLTTHIPRIRMIVSMKLESSLLKYSRTLSETPDGKELAKVISNLSDALSTTGESIYAGDNYVVRYPEQYCSYDDPTPRDYLTDLQAAKASGDMDLYNDLLQLSYKSSYLYVFQKDYLSPYFSANFSITKEIGDLASISFYANNFFVNRSQLWSSKTRTYLSAANYIPKFYYGLTLRLKF